LLCVINNKYNYLKFQYYVWDFSSEDLLKRERAEKKVIQMGVTAIPFLIDELSHPYIFESYHISNCLKKITRDTNTALIDADHKRYWKTWWIKNSNRYK